MRRNRIHNHCGDCWGRDFRGAGVSPVAFPIFNIEQIAGKMPAPPEK
jgi:hypothetical protein